MIVGVFSRHASHRPNDVAVLNGDESISYGELARRANALQRRLRTEYGIGEGHLVALRVPNGWEFVASFLALAGLGAIAIPFHTGWRAQEVGSLVARLGISAIISERDDHVAMGSLSPKRVVVVDNALQSPASVDEPLLSGLADNPVVYFSTSGSTGRPKVAVRTQQALVAGAANVGAALGVTRDHRFAGVVPFYHANGFSNSMLLPLIHGARIVTMRSFAPRPFAEMVRREQIDVLIGSPFIFSMLVESNVEAEAFSTVKVALSSGATLTRDLASACRRKLGLCVRQLYGSSETGTIAIQSETDVDQDASVGTTIGGIEVRVVDNDGREVPAGANGEILVRGPAMMIGYAGEPELNEQAFRDGFFRMGDTGYVDDQDRLVVTGRIKRLINLGGTKVDPVEIETVVSGLPGVRHCRVTTVQDRRQMEVIRLIVALQPGATLTRAEVMEHCRAQLAEYKLPRQIHLVDGDAVDATGKFPMS